MTDQKRTPMKLGAMAEQIRQIENARDSAQGQVNSLITGIHNAYAGFDRAYRSAVSLEESGAVHGEQAAELRTLRERFECCRDLLAETGFLVAHINPAGAYRTWLTPMKTAATAGMTAKRLSEWEADALREAVVEALAGGGK